MIHCDSFIPVKHNYNNNAAHSTCVSSRSTNLKVRTALRMMTLRDEQTNMNRDGGSSGRE